MARPVSLHTLRLLHFAATLVLIIGCLLAARAFPGGFDWPYQVMSELASLKHNPAGGRWFSAALTVAMLLLWPLPVALSRGRTSSAGRFAAGALRFGIAFGIAMGLERAVFFHVSDFLYKAHEILALLCFLGLYVGSFAYCLHRLRVYRGVVEQWVFAGVLATLVAIGAVQLFLWWVQRDLGWVGRDWRAQGIPVGLSFAFWQWIASAALLLVLGVFAWVRPVSPRGA